MKRKAPRHAFKFKIERADGTAEVVKIWVKVHRATKPVDLLLTAADVRRSIKAKGVGNTQTCSMAMCATRLASAFPHPVAGPLDWTYSRFFVASKRSRQTGLPTDCVEYAHNDTIAKLNDTKGGQKKLLAELEAEGDRVIRLFPVPVHSKSPKGRPSGRRDGSRSAKPHPIGAKARFAFAQLGGVA